MYGKYFFLNKFVWEILSLIKGFLTICNNIHYKMDKSIYPFYNVDKNAYKNSQDFGIFLLFIIDKYSLLFFLKLDWDFITLTFSLFISCASFG